MCKWSMGATGSLATEGRQRQVRGQPNVVTSGRGNLQLREGLKGALMGWRGPRRRIRI